MENKLIKEEFLKKYPSIEEDIIKNQIEWNNLMD
ncbi:RelA/SpoT domain-containing protein, partial [Clostridium botulinum CFSAN001627]